MDLTLKPASNINYLGTFIRAGSKAQWWTLIMLDYKELRERWLKSNKCCKSK